MSPSLLQIKSVEMNPVAGENAKPTQHHIISNNIRCKKKVKHKANNKSQEERLCRIKMCKEKTVTGEPTLVDQDAGNRLRSEKSESTQSRLLGRIIVRRKVHPILSKQDAQCGNGITCRCKKHTVVFGAQKKKTSIISKTELPIRISNTRPDEIFCNVASTATTKDRNPVQFVGKLKYEKLMLSLQSPFPNEHQFSLEACLVLSKMREKPSSMRLDVLEKTPSLLNMLLAHAGFYSDCALRSLTEQLYREAFNDNYKQNCYDFAVFWEQLCCVHASDTGFEDDDFVGEQQHHKIKSQLLCECYPGRPAELSESEKQVTQVMAVDSVNIKCCAGCRTKPIENEDNAKWKSDLPYTRTLSMIQTSESLLALEKIGNRIELVAQILRNFSFDKGNALVMIGNKTMLRFLLIAVQTNYRSYTQIAFDIISNIFGSFSKVKIDPVIFQLQSMIVDLVISTFMLSRDRFKIIRCAEAISGLAMSGNRQSRMTIVNHQLCERLLQLLTLKEDVILVVNCLECMLAITDIGLAVCDEMLLVQGSLTTLMSYVAMETKMNNEVNIAIRSTRLTALLILRNVVKYSRNARRSLKRYETRLANLAMSEEDCSWVTTEILSYLADEESYR